MDRLELLLFTDATNGLLTVFFFCDLEMFERIIAVVFQSVFYLKIHQNNFFILKKLFLISTYQNNSKIYKK